MRTKEELEAEIKAKVEEAQLSDTLGSVLIWLGGLMLEEIIDRSGDEPEMDQYQKNVQEAVDEIAFNVRKHGKKG